MREKVKVESSDLSRLKTSNKFPKVKNINIRWRKKSEQCTNLKANENEVIKNKEKKMRGKND